MVMAGIGGALAPASSLPGWAQAAGHATPAYWALNALRDVTLNGAGLRQVAWPVVILLGFTATFVTVAALRFRPTDAKVGTT
jgi:ABC-2 type transport system permease protein